jgi:hypothetical protein
VSNQGQDIPQQLTLFTDANAFVEGRPYEQIQAKSHFLHPQEDGMTLCLVPTARMRPMYARGLKIGSLSGLAQCKNCQSAARRLEDVIRQELSTWVDGLWEGDGVSNTPSNEDL